MKRRVADIIIETLVQNNITDCFLVVGGGAMHLDNALALNKDMKKYCNHHEQACAMAAEAYARVSGKMAAVCVTSGPGATNTLTGIMGAWQDSIPLIVVSGQVRYETMAVKTGLPLRYRGIQEFDIVPTVSSMTKYAVMIKEPLTVRREINKAIQIAMEGRRGPVWIDVPLDIQGSVIEEEELYADYTEWCKIEEKNDSIKEECRCVLEELARAKRPCILGGTGIVSGNVQKEFIQFIEKLGIPVVGGGWCTDMLYTEHPLYYGLSGDIGPRTGNFIIQNADTILVLGNSLSYRQTGFAQEKFAPEAKILWIDVDKAEALKPGMRAEHFVNIELRKFFEICEEIGCKRIENKAWTEYCNKLKSRFTPYESIENLDMGGRVNSYYFWKMFDEYAPEDQVISMGNSRGNAAKIQIGVKKRCQRAITNYLCGSMGYDIPAAIGCAVAVGREVLCITGDGSIMMNLQELQTIRQYDLPVKIVVFSNDGYEAIRQTCKNFFKGVYLGCTKESGVSFPEFEKLAEAFGYGYRCCHTNEEVDDSLKWLFAEKGNVFLEVLQQVENPLIPKLMSRMREDGTFETPALHDMAPFLSKEEIDELMIGESDEG